MEHHRHRFFKRAVAFDLKGLKHGLREAEGFNAKIAVFLTHIVGTMWCAYLFCLLALAGLPTALGPGGAGIVSWIAQTFIQLVLLSVIMVGQNVQGIASDARAEHTYEDTEEILDRLDLKTEGGIKAILDAIEALGGPHGNAPGGVPVEESPGAAPPAPPGSRTGPQAYDAHLW